MRRGLAVLISVLTAVWPLLLPQPAVGNPCENNVTNNSITTTAGHSVDQYGHNKVDQDADGGEGKGGYATANENDSSTTGGDNYNDANPYIDTYGDNKANAYANGGYAQSQGGAYGGDTGNADGGYSGHADGGDTGHANGGDTGYANGGYTGNAYADANDTFKATGAKNNSFNYGDVRGNEGENEKNYTNDYARASSGNASGGWSGDAPGGWSGDADGGRTGSASGGRTGSANADVSGGSANGGWAFGGYADGDRSVQTGPVDQRASADAKSVTGVALAKGGTGGAGGSNSAEFSKQGHKADINASAVAEGLSIGTIGSDCKNIMRDVTGGMQIIGDIDDSIVGNVSAKYGNAAAGSINVGELEFENYGAKGVNINLNPNTNQNTNLLNFGNMGVGQ